MSRQPAHRLRHATVLLVTAAFTLIHTGCAQQPVHTAQTAPTPTSVQSAQALIGQDRAQVLQALSLKKVQKVMVLDTEPPLRLHRATLANGRPISLAFEADKLVTVLDLQDSDAFWNCRHATLARGENWFKALPSHRSWLAEHNALARQDKEDKPAKTPADEPASIGDAVGDTIGMLLFAPLIVAMLPVAGVATAVDKASGGEARQTRREKLQADRDQAADQRYESIAAQLGTDDTLQTVQDKAGTLTFVQNIGELQYFVYSPSQMQRKDYDIGIYMRNDRLVAIEQPAAFKSPIDRMPVVRAEGCGSR